MSQISTTYKTNMSYSVGVMSYYMKIPSESHIIEIKHTLRYLRGTMGYIIKYERTREQLLVRYSDISRNIDPDDGRSITGHVFYYGSSPITWCYQKQDIIALSLCKVDVTTIKFELI